MFIFVVYFVMIQSGNFWIHPRTTYSVQRWSLKKLRQTNILSAETTRLVLRYKEY